MPVQPSAEDYQAHIERLYGERNAALEAQFRVGRQRDAALRAQAEVFEGLEKIEAIIAGISHDVPGLDVCDQCDPHQKLARVALIVGRLIAATR